MNTIEARKSSLAEMLEMRLLKQGVGIEYFSTALISMTRGTALLWASGFIPNSNFQAELVRGSMSLIQPQVTRSSAGRVAEVIEQ